MEPHNMYIARIRKRLDASLQTAVIRVRKPSSWALPKQHSSAAPEYVWANAGNVVRLEDRVRRG
jgi:hypothetical protein